MADSEIFGECGPRHLEIVDWSLLDHKKSVAASLIKGVKVKEQDRQQRRMGKNALAPIWSEFFQFQCIETLVDEVDKSVFGAIFKYKTRKDDRNKTQSNPASRSIPPSHVIAFRGTHKKWLTLGQDIYNDLKLYFNELNQSTRYATSLKAVKALVDKVGPKNVWLTGHSLGAAIALLIGKTMAREGCHIETYLFNPPFLSPPFEKLHSEDLKCAIRVIKSLLTVGLFVAVKGTKHSTQEYDPSSTLRGWIPYLFVNQKDFVCCEYIGHFKHRQTMKMLGMGDVQKIADKVSIKSLLTGACGGESEAHHLIPSAYVVKNVYPMKDKFKTVHGINQWWASHNNWETTLEEDYK